MNSSVVMSVPPPTDSVIINAGIEGWLVRSVNKDVVDMLLDELVRDPFRPSSESRSSSLVLDSWTRVAFQTSSHTLRVPAGYYH